MNNNETPKIRQSNIELLRIFSMIMIVAHHFSVHGKFIITSTLSINNIWLQFLSSGGKIGVDIFVIISGYFLINSKNIKIQKVLKLVFQILLYSILIFTLFVLLKIEPFSIKQLIKHILGYPIWWFARSYLVLYLIHPYINKLLNMLEKNEYKKIIVLLTILFSILPTITTIKLDNGSLVWFIYLYLLGGYFKKYPLNLKANKCFVISIILYALTFASVICFDYIAIKRPGILKYTTYLFEMEMLPTLLISIFIFLWFNAIKIKNSKIINIVSSTTFGIYLIHDSDYVKKFLWETLFKNSNYANSKLLIPYSLLVIFLVFIMCFIIEFVRIYLLEKKCDKLINKISIFINKIIDRFFNLKFINNI